ncbi:MAG: DMT family transporter [Oscillospiraceae bacterium]
MNEKKRSTLATIALMLVAIIWGSGFIGTEYALKANLPIPWILFLRFAIATVILAFFSIKEIKKMDRKALFHGIVAGVLLYCGFYLQTFGQSESNVANSSFLTATNVVMVPFIVWLLNKKRPPAKTFVLACTTLIGIGFLTLKFENGKLLSLGYGDVLTILCAFFFALHIAYLGKYGLTFDAKLMTFLQMAVAAAVSGILLLVKQVPLDVSTLKAGAMPVLYIAVFSTCICYFLQTKAQQHVTPSKASVILCTEGLFGTIFSIILGMVTLTSNIVIGGIIIFVSVVLTEVDIRALLPKRKTQE